MANWSTLKAAIAQIIKTNNNQEITGANMQSVLNNIIDNVGENSTFAGIATPTTNQDTNTAQFKFVSLLAEKYKNLCVVGDDDQSIYRFRGANPSIMLNFEKE